MRIDRLFICLVIFLPILSRADGIDYQRAAKINSVRLAKVVYRYIHLYEDPCLYVEALSPPDNWRVIYAKKICSYEGKDFYNGYASADFSDVSIQEGAIKFNIKLITLPPVEEKVLKCLFEFKDGMLEEPRCEQ